MKSKLDTATLAQITEYFEYLDQLRESGVTNMYGAGAYLIRTYGISREESHDILGSWMRTFNEDDPAEKRARQTIMEGK